MYNVHGLEHYFFKKNMSIHLKFINKFNVQLRCTITIKLNYNFKNPARFWVEIWQVDSKSSLEMQRT